jgi:hypothetical protein
MKLQMMIITKILNYLKNFISKNFYRLLITRIYLAFILLYSLPIESKQDINLNISGIFFSHATSNLININQRIWNIYIIIFIFLISFLTVTIFLSLILNKI